MKKGLFYSRRLCLLFLFAISSSCMEKSDKGSDNSLSEAPEAQAMQGDSILISVNFKSKGITGFNIKDNYHQYYFLEFDSGSHQDTVITKKIPRYHKNQVIDISGIEMKNGNPVFYENYFLVDSTQKKVSFDFSNDIVALKGRAGKINIDSIHSAYNKLGLKIKNSGRLDENLKKNLNSELEHLYSRSSKKTSALEKEIVEGYYIQILQMIHPLDRRVDSFVESADAPTACNPFSSILFKYVHDRIGLFEFSELNSEKYPPQYISLLSIGIFNFLRFEDNKGDPQYKGAIDWLKTTELYKKDPAYIESEIVPLDNELFKEKMEKISLLSTANKSVGFKQVLMKNPSDYYLIDFWATWCGPCIQGIHKMNGMKLPGNVKVVSISTDNKGDVKKWIKMTQKLKQSISYRLDEASSASKEFTDLIEMQSIPRYILIDKDLNLIDQNFFHPHEPQFSIKLRDVENHKYW